LVEMWMALGIGFVGGCVDSGGKRQAGISFDVHVRDGFRGVRSGERRTRCSRLEVSGCNGNQQRLKNQDEVLVWNEVKSLLTDSRRNSARWSSSPRESMDAGSWVKLICGASMEDVVQARSLALVYTLVGVDCIDCAADAAITRAVLQGIQAASILRTELNMDAAKKHPKSPWVMISVSDDADLHFRKAKFDPQSCPKECTRPCEKVCPADAISINGVIESKCYGCGRCLVSVCPLGLILAEDHIRKPEDIMSLLENPFVNALEIHTRPNSLIAFEEFCRKLIPTLQSHPLQLISVSAPQLPNYGEALESMHNVLTQYLDGSPTRIMWQTDGRPMSGDVGGGTAHASVRLAKVAKQELVFRSLRGVVQLAGGTNEKTFEILRSQGLENEFAGVAFGGSARKPLAKIFDSLSHRSMECENQEFLEEHPDLLLEAIKIATRLVSPFKDQAFPTKEPTK